MTEDSRKTAPGGWTRRAGWTGALLLVGVGLAAAAPLRAEQPDRNVTAPGDGPKIPGAATATLESTGPHTLRIAVIGLRSTRGNVYCKLYDRTGKFPSSDSKGTRGAKAKPAVGADGMSAVCVFRNLPAGRYAAAIAHDENGNGKVDRTLIGLPKEGYGFSNNARVSIAGAPSFRQASFPVTGDTRHEVRVVYP